MNEMDVGLRTVKEKSLDIDGLKCSKVKLKDHLIRTIRIPETRCSAGRFYRLCADLVASTALGAVQGVVRRLDYLQRSVVTIVSFGYANADGYGHTPLRFFDCRRILRI